MYSHCPLIVKAYYVPAAGNLSNDKSVRPYNLGNFFVLWKKIYPESLRKKNFVTRFASNNKSVINVFCSSGLYSVWFGRFHYWLSDNNWQQLRTTNPFHQVRNILIFSSVKKYNLCPHWVKWVKILKIVVWVFKKSSVCSTIYAISSIFLLVVNLEIDCITAKPSHSWFQWICSKFFVLWHGHHFFWPPWLWRRL